MEESAKKAVEEYQCSGCSKGPFESCFKQNAPIGVGCGEHYPGTTIMGVGKIFPGMPRGFNRLGKQEDMRPRIFEEFEDNYNMWNVPTWKYLSPDGHTFVRGIMPRRNEAFLDIFLEDCRDKINCLEITQENIDFMD
jgi:hypothetical protein